MRKKASLSLTLSTAAIACVLMTGCGQKRATVTLAGSTAFQSFAEKLGDQYAGIRQDVVINVQGGGSFAGIQSAISGAAQIGMADLAKLPPEAEQLWKVVVARDGIAVIVNPANPAADLTVAQLRDVFNGVIKNWKEIGGADKSITVVSREEGSGTRSSFEQIVSGISLSKDAIVQDSNGTIRETVANDVNSIGYVSHGVLSEKVKAIRIDGQECSSEGMKTGSYLLVRPIYLLTKGQPAGPVKDFIDFVLSPEGQRTIETSGLVPAK